MENPDRAILRWAPIITVSPARKASGGWPADGEPWSSGPQAADLPGSCSLVHVGWRREDRQRSRCHRTPFGEAAEYLSALVVAPVAKPGAVEWMVSVSAAPAAVSFARPAVAFPGPLVLAVVVLAAQPGAVEWMAPVSAVSAAVSFAQPAAVFPVPLVLAPALAHGRRPVSGRSRPDCA